MTHSSEAIIVVSDPMGNDIVIIKNRLSGLLPPQPQHGLIL